MGWAHGKPRLPNQRETENGRFARDECFQARGQRRRGVEIPGHSVVNENNFGIATMPEHEVGQAGAPRMADHQSGRRKTVDQQGGAHGQGDVDGFGIQPSSLAAERRSWAPRRRFSFCRIVKAR